MSVTEIKQALGSWTLQLKPETPQQVLDALTFFGHIALLPGQIDPVQYGDNLLTAARYVGVYRNRDASDRFVLKGSGMAFWLGDADDKGDILESLVTISGQSFSNTIRALLPTGGSITEGTLYSVAGTYSGTHQWVTPRAAITYVTDLFGAEWRLNNNGTLDAGPLSSLYVTTPNALVLRRGYGSDLVRRAIPGEMSMAVDVEDVTTRVVLLAEGEGTSIATASANAPATPYKDIHGNAVKMTRLISESGTDASNAVARAQLQLNRFLNARRAVDLSTSEYDVKGTFVVGDYIDVYDPESGFYDANREIYWQTEHINPMALRCVEMSWPIPPGWTVAFRDINGNWIDLSTYYVGEDGDTTIVVGELARGLSTVSGEPVGVRPNLPDASTPAPDATIPAAPAFTGFSTGSYESDDHTLAAIYAQWAQPLNSDASTITDGDHYEIRYRPNQVIGTSTPWDYLGGGFTSDGEDDFNTTYTNGWGPSWVNLSTSSELSASAGEGQITHPTFNIIRGTQFGTTDWADVEVLRVSKISYTPTGASTVLGTIARRNVAGDTYYWCRVEPNTDLSVTAKITKYMSGVYSELATLKIPGMVHVPNIEYCAKLTISGNAIAFKVWQGTPSVEPERDTLNVLDGNPISAAGKIGVWDYIVGGATNPAGSVTRTPYFRVRSLVSDNVANAYTWDGLGTWDALTSIPVAATPNWTIAYVGWDQTAFTLTGLGPGVQYEFQIRAVDRSTNYSPWSTSQFVNTSGDAVAPSAPAAPEVAASLIAVQVTHRLGKASGGTFNLEPDLHHFNVHAAGSPTFYPDGSNKVGELLASGSMIRGGIPAIGTFKVDQPDQVWVRVVAVDRTGNPSAPSDAVQSSVVLIDNAHISDLSVSKLTAGTITAQSVLAAEMEVGAGGNIKLTEGSLDVYNNFGQQMVEAGLLSNGDYGLAAVDPATGGLVDLATLAFGIRADTVSAAVTLTTQSFTDLPGSFGPQVTVTIGNSGRCLVTLSCQIASQANPNLGTSSGAGYASFDLTGATALSPNFARSVYTEIFYDQFGSEVVPTIQVKTGSSRVILLESLNPGVHTFTMKYINFGDASPGATFSNRLIIVQPF